MSCPDLWPHLTGYCAAAGNLRDVIAAAIDKITPSPSQVIYKDVIIKAAACLGHPDFFTLPGPSSQALTETEHLARTTAARTHALNNTPADWNLCIIELDHAGGGGAPVSGQGGQEAKKKPRGKKRPKRRR